jgi:hypothetical protein
LVLNRSRGSFELPDARGVAHFAQRLRLDLADALARDLELLAHFLSVRE